MAFPSKYREIEIPEDSPFMNDKLGMAGFANTMSSLVQMYGDSGAVIALDGAWGTGKTTFMQMWRKKLALEGVKSVYFNAWETDYFKDPLTAIIGELNEIYENDTKFKDIAVTAGKILVGAGIAVVQKKIKDYTGLDAAEAKTAVKGIEESVFESLNNYKNEKAAVGTFKKDLSRFVADSGSCPFVFIVDELDRCNPTYAVKVLETIKHFFDVPNIVFVLAINKEQLETSIKGFYGSSEMDAGNYLRRFFDIQIELPRPSPDKFCEMLFDHYCFSDYFEIETKDRREIKADEFKQIVRLFCNTTNVDLRTWDRLFAHTRLVAQQFGNRNQVIIELIFFLCYLKVTGNELYESFKQKELSVQELIDKIEKELPRELIEKKDYYAPREKDNRSLIYVIGEFLVVYDFNVNGSNGSFVSAKEEAEDFPFKFNIIPEDTIRRVPEWCSRVLRIEHPMEFFTNKIDLADSFR